MLERTYRKEVMKYTVSVALSSYNGEKYISKQIKSIIEQNNVETYIHIRDDGSNDGTVRQIKKEILKYPNRITLEEGENIGYQRSFLKALKDSPKSDYYAFADQDDVWLSDKCIRAIKQIENKVDFYASSVTLVDEDERIIGENNIGNMVNSIECYFARPRLAGCTFVFTDEIRLLALKIAEGRYTTYPDHDFVVAACAFAFGNVVLDSKSFILHRRLSSSVTGGSNGIIKRIRVEKNVIFNKNKVARDLARNILDYSKLNENVIDFLSCLANYDKSLKQKFALVKFDGFSTGLKICDMETFLKILIGTL